MFSDSRFELGSVNMAGLPQWGPDHSYNFHPTIQATLDHPVSRDELSKALEETLAVAPVARKSLIVHDSQLRFVKNPLPFVISSGDGILAPGSHAANGHAVSLDIKGNTLTASFLHSMMDGLSMCRFFMTLLCHYCSIHFGGEYRCSDMVLRPEGTEEDMWTLPYDGPADYVPPEVLMKGIPVEEFCKGESETYRCCDFHVSTASLIAATKGLHTSPAVLLFLLFARTICELRPDVDGPMVALMMMNARNAMGMPDTLLNCGVPALLSVGRGDVVSDDAFRQAAITQRALLKSQADPAYMKYMLEKGRRSGFDASLTYIVSYMRQDFGDCRGHVRDFRFFDPSAQKINLVDIGGDSMYVSLLLGEATDRYTKALKRVLGDFGIEITDEGRAFSVQAEKDYGNLWEPPTVAEGE